MSAPPIRPTLARRSRAGPDGDPLRAARRAAHRAVQPLPQGRRRVLLPVRQVAAVAVLPGAVPGARSWTPPTASGGESCPHNYERVSEPSGTGGVGCRPGPDLVRPSTLLLHEPEFAPNPTGHPCRFPVDLPAFFIKLLTTPGQVVSTPSAEPGPPRWPPRPWAAVALTEADAGYAGALAARLETGTGTPGADRKKNYWKPGTQSGPAVTFGLHRTADRGPLSTASSRRDGARPRR